MKKLIFALALVASLAYARTPVQIVESGYLKFGVFPSQAPISYVGEDGNFDGYDVLLAHRIAKDLGVKARFTPLNVRTMIDALRKDKVDILLTNVVITEDRAHIVDFLRPYRRNASGLIARKGVKIGSFEDLNGKNIALVKGSNTAKFFEDFLPGEVNLLEFDDHEDAVNALKNGAADAYATSWLGLYRCVRENPEFVYTDLVFGEVNRVAPAIKKGELELARWLNAEMAKLGKEGFFRKLYDETLKDVLGGAFDVDEVIIDEKNYKF